MSNAPTFPIGSILSVMKLDIYASKKRDDVWIWHDSPFEQELVELFFDPFTRKLKFLFTNGENCNLGAPISSTLAPHLEKVEEIAIYQIDPNTMKPLAVKNVPFRVSKEL